MCLSGTTGAQCSNEVVTLFILEKRFKVKEDILSCTAAELNYGLAQFVKEIASPSGEYYEPDSVYYLCLGIQQVCLGDMWISLDLSYFVCQCDIKITFI